MVLSDFEIIFKHDIEWELEDLDLIQTQWLFFVPIRKDFQMQFQPL